MPLAFGLLTLGAWVMYAGFKGLSLIEVLAGKEGDTLNPDAKVTDFQDAGDFGGDSSTPSGDNVNKSSKGTRQFDGQPIAAWIWPVLLWARRHGWNGRVTSGWRDPNRVITPSPGLPVAPQGQSNHNKTEWPGGAVDVSDADSLEKVLKGYPGGPPLKRGTAIGDPIHFSVKGN